MSKAKYQRRPVLPALLAALVAASTAGLAAIMILALIPVEAWWADATHYYTGIEFWRVIWMELAAGTRLVAIPGDLGGSAISRVLSVSSSVIVAAIVFARRAYGRTPLVDSREHYDGAQLFRGALAQRMLASAMSDACPVNAEIISGVSYPRAWRVQNLLIAGAIGSGKTRILLSLIESIVRRVNAIPEADEALLLHDTTGEILTGLPVDDALVAAIHPHKVGGWGWAMGADLTLMEDMEEVADQAIGDTGEAVWGKGAALLYAGILAIAAGEHAEVWSMPEVYEIALRSPENLKAALEQYYLPAAKLVEFDADGNLSKTSLSFLLTFRASSLRVIRPIAEAWANVPHHRMFSFRAWIHQDHPAQPKIVVIQRSGRHAELSALWIGMVIDALASHAGDPDLGVSQSRLRTLVLDELPALGFLRRLPELMDTGRNKGVAFICAVQDVNLQIDRIYKDWSESIRQRFRLKIFCSQTAGPETLKIASETIGKRRVEDRTFTTTITRGPQGKTEQVAENRRIDEVPIVSPDYLAQELGVRGDRVRAILVGLQDPLELEWPLRIWENRR